MSSAEPGEASKPANYPRLYAALGSAFGLLFLVAIPPFQVPDEATHFWRAYHVSEGHAFPEPLGPWGGAELPAGVVDAAGAFSRLVAQPFQKARLSDVRDRLAAPLHPRGRERLPYAASAGYRFGPFLPRAAGIAAARAAGLSPLAQFYTGRFVSLLVAVALVTLAVRLTPVLKPVFVMAALLPVAVQQSASLSPDAL